MKSTTKKKPKEIEKEIKLKLIQTIEGLLIKSDASSVKKLKKAIKSAAFDIAKKYVKAAKKSDKKNEKKKSKGATKVVAKKAKTPAKRVRTVKAKKPVLTNNGKAKLPIITE